MFLILHYIDKYDYDYQSSWDQGLCEKVIGKQIKGGSKKISYLIKKIKSGQASRNARDFYLIKGLL